MLPHNAENIDIKQPNQCVAQSELELHHPKNCKPPRADFAPEPEAQQAQPQNRMTFPTENVTNEHRGSYLGGCWPRISMAKWRECCRPVAGTVSLSGDYALASLFRTRYHWLILVIILLTSHYCILAGNLIRRITIMSLCWSFWPPGYRASDLAMAPQMMR